MTKFEFTITIGASPVNFAVAAIAAGQFPQGAVNLFSATYLPSCRLSVQLKSGSTGPVYIGGALVTTTGTGPADFEVILPGDFKDIISQTDRNTADLSQYFAHGATTGDKLFVSYYQI